MKISFKQIPKSVLIPAILLCLPSILGILCLFYEEYFKEDISFILFFLSIVFFPCFMAYGLLRKRKWTRMWICIGCLFYCIANIANPIGLVFMALPYSLGVVLPLFSDSAKKWFATPVLKTQRIIYPEPKFSSWMLRIVVCGNRPTTASVASGVVFVFCSTFFSCLYPLTTR